MFVKIPLATYLETNELPTNAPLLIGKRIGEFEYENRKRYAIKMKDGSTEYHPEKDLFVPICVQKFYTLHDSEDIKKIN